MGTQGLAFLAGLGGGVLQGQQRQREQARQDKQDAAFDQDQAWQQQQRDQARGLQRGLADAARPAEVSQGAGGMIRPDTMDDRDVGLPENSQPAAAVVNGQTVQNAPAAANGGLAAAAYRGAGGQQFDTLDAAQKSVDAYNTPAAKMQRQGAAYDTAGQPAQGLAMSNAAAQVEARKQALIEQTRKYQSENYGEALARLRSGDGAGAAAAFNKSGKLKIDGGIDLKPVDRDIPGIGTIKTYDATFNMVGEDGKVRPMTINSHDASMQTMPYEKQIELQRKGSDSDAKLQQGLATLDMKGKQIELQGELAAARASRAGAGGSDKTSREERIRYTSLFTEAGRRLSESQKALNTLTSGSNSMLFMSSAKRNPDGPEAQQLRGLQDDITQNKADRALYQGMLAGSQGDGAAAPSVKPGAKTATPAPATPPKAVSLPKAGDVQSGYRFKGGNPADRASWEPVK